MRRNIISLDSETHGLFRCTVNSLCEVTERYAGKTYAEVLAVVHEIVAFDGYDNYSDMERISLLILLASFDEDSAGL